MGRQSEPHRVGPLLALFLGKCLPNPTGERVPVTGDPENPFMNIDVDVRERLRLLLYQPEMRGVGYSAFLNRACEIAEQEIVDNRAEIARLDAAGAAARGES